MTNRVRLYMRLFTTSNQSIKSLDQMTKQASMGESSDEVLILMIKILDRLHRWKYKAYSGDYPWIVTLTFILLYLECDYPWLVTLTFHSSLVCIIWNTT